MSRNPASLPQLALKLILPLMLAAVVVGMLFKKVREPDM
jgi:hypothetical protein